MTTTKPARLARQRLRFELADETVHDVIVNNASLVAWDRTSAQRWPFARGNGAPLLMLTFLAWHSAKAQGAYAGKFEDFETTDCVAIEAIDQDGESVDLSDPDLEPEYVDPTRPVADSDSALS